MEESNLNHVVDAKLDQRDRRENRVRMVEMETMDDQVSMVPMEEVSNCYRRDLPNSMHISTLYPSLCIRN